MSARPNFRQREFVSTQSGIEIGRAYVAPPQPIGSEAATVQRLILTPIPTRPSAWHRLVRWVKWRSDMARLNRAFPGCADAPPPF